MDQSSQLLYLNISMHIRHIILYIFPKVLMRRIFLTTNPLTPKSD